MDEKMNQARKVYDHICSAIEARKWRYNKDEDKLTVFFSVTGEDIPMHFVISVDAGRSLIRLTSPMMFDIPEDKRVDGALAACGATYGLADGSFDYDITDGSIAFRMTASYRESEISEYLLQYMISSACRVVDRYNDKFLMLAKGKLDASAFFDE